MGGEDDAPGAALLSALPTKSKPSWQQQPGEVGYLCPLWSKRAVPLLDQTLRLLMLGQNDPNPDVPDAASHGGAMLPTEVPQPSDEDADARRRARNQGTKSPSNYRTRRSQLTAVP